MKNPSTGQINRLIHMIVYLCILFLANYLSFGQCLPYTDQRGLWFFSGLAALILGSLIVTPFFTSPANAISYSIAALVAIFSTKSAEQTQQLPFWLMTCFCIMILVFSIVSIVLKDSKKQLLLNLANMNRVISDQVGNPRIVYTLILFYSLYSFHRESALQIFYISASGIIIIALRPLENFSNIIATIKKFWIKDSRFNYFGTVVAYQTPNIILIRQEADSDLPFKKCAIINDPHTSNKLAIILDHVGRDEGMLVRAIQIFASKSQTTIIQNMLDHLSENTIALLDRNIVNELSKDNYVIKHSENLVGIVAPDTSIDKLFFEIVDDKDIEEGKLVETYVSGKMIIYQIIDGLTKEEIVYQKNTFGYARGQARKIGIWDSEYKKFIPSKWLPNPNSPVFLKTPEGAEDTDRKILGRFPGSSYSVSIKDIHKLVTHNTAILGILGVGKTMLALELVERLISERIKVICIDLTNQYQTELISFYDEVNEISALENIKNIGAAGKVNCKQNVEEGGSIKEFETIMRSEIDLFVKSGSLLKIYNPTQFEVWKQESKPYNGIASMATLSPAEITRIITEEILYICQSLGMTDQARTCIVFEEAHTLIPEWNSVAIEGDKAASNGTARAILQGRKYGLGCLLITQRTANVTKTILNQCNTIFAMRTFDETGKDFLSNYFGNDYSKLLSSLPERSAIFFGRASSCENPVLIRLNDRDKFIQNFRTHTDEPHGPVVS